MQSLSQLRCAGLFSCLLFIALFLASCGNCRWVEDCHNDEGGYWDCPETESPVESISTTPDLEITISGNRFTATNNTRTAFSIDIKNRGDGIAREPVCTIKISRPDFGGSYAMTTILNEKKTLSSLSPSTSITLNSNVSENMTMSGFGIYSVTVEVTCTDEQGKPYHSSAYTEY